MVGHVRLVEALHREDLFAYLALVEPPGWVDLRFVRVRGAARGRRVLTWRRRGAFRLLRRRVHFFRFPVADRTCVTVTARLFLGGALVSPSPSSLLFSGVLSARMRGQLRGGLERLRALIATRFRIFDDRRFLLRLFSAIRGGGGGSDNDLLF